MKAMTHARRRYGELLDQLYGDRARGPLSSDEEYKYTQAMMDLWHQLTARERREVETLGEKHNRAMEDRGIWPMRAFRQQAERGAAGATMGYATRVGLRRYGQVGARTQRKRA